jgi:hypothetical protein
MTVRGLRGSTMLPRNCVATSISSVNQSWANSVEQCSSAYLELRPTAYILKASERNAQCPCVTSRRQCYNKTMKNMLQPYLYRYPQSIKRKLNQPRSLLMKPNHKIQTYLLAVVDPLPLSLVYRHNEAENPRLTFLQACNFCRMRKGKCDEQRPACGACIRLKLTCKYGSRRKPKQVVQLS